MQQKNKTIAAHSQCYIGVSAHELKRDNEVDVSEHELLLRHPEVLRALLKDHTRTEYEKGKLRQSEVEVDDDRQWNIIWGTDSYKSEGDGFGERDEITEEKITGKHRLLVRPRAVKEKDVQRQRSRDMAEVFTPAWICNAQNNLVDDAWFGRSGVFNQEFLTQNGEHRWAATRGRIAFDEKPSKKSTKSWKEYVRDVRLEISCGEAPYIVSRYDAVTGKPERDLNQRVGLLDRKLRVVSEHTKKPEKWLEWAREAVMSVYGFEWQGDNLLLAREAVLFSVLDYYKAKFKKELRNDETKEFASIISWNFWQMDGLKMVLPYSCEEVSSEQMEMFSDVTKKECRACTKGIIHGHIGVKCKVRDWKQRDEQQIIVFETLFKSN